MPARAFALEEDVRDEHEEDVFVSRNGLSNGALPGPSETVEPEYVFLRVGVGDPIIDLV